MPFQFLETIKIINGIPQHLEFHNQRLNYTRQHFNLQSNIIDLKQFIVPPACGIYKCRVIYSNTIEDIQYSDYTDRQFKTFQPVIANDINYQFKYLNREVLNQLQAGAKGADDILIIKNGFVTDTSIANVAFYDEDKWITPTTVLLQGTTRARLLKQKKIIAAPIRLEDINNFSKMALMNALLGFYVIKQPIINKIG